MQIDNLQSDDLILSEIGERIARVRLSRNLSQVQVSRESGVSRDTVQRLEAGDSIGLAALVRVLRVLGLLSGLDAAIPESIASPIEQLDRGGSQRRRASSARSANKWRWGTP
jgi:transcriptional regulator with XRE-family HTH domain